MNARPTLTPADLRDIPGYLDRRVAALAVSSQPEVVVRVLDLAREPLAELSDYAAVIRADHALAGRLLKLANSAMFSQRSPITSIERACLVLGLERIKSISLGFHLSRAAADAGDRDLTRRVWGESVMRACVAAELARAAAPAHVPEAFVIGLMLDASVPLMPRLLGPDYMMVTDGQGPSQRVRTEQEVFPFTHVQAVAALCRQWKLPDLLAGPIALHHTKPPSTPPADAGGRLHRIAYIAGQMDVAAGGVNGAAGLNAAPRLLGLKDEELSWVVSRSVSEYAGAMAVFGEIADGLTGDDLAERVHATLVEVIDQRVHDSLEREQQEAPRRVSVGGHSVELTREADGITVAYLYDSAGERLLSHRVHGVGASARAVAEALGLELAQGEEIMKLQGDRKAA